MVIMPACMVVTCGDCVRVLVHIVCVCVTLDVDWAAFFFVYGGPLCLFVLVR